MDLLIGLGIVVAFSIVLKWAFSPKKKTVKLVETENNIIDIAEKVKPVIEDRLVVVETPIIKVRKPRVKKTLLTTTTKAKVKKSKKVVSKKKK